MKASLKFRDEQKPLFRAKVPINLLGFPFQSGVSAGESKELSLQLGTFFESGPSLKIAYKPNDTWNPFTLVLKTGTGPYGSPISSSMMMSAEFNLIGNRGNPSFFIHFKPRFGDFSIKKSQSSVLSKKLNNSPTKGLVLEDDINGSVEVVDRPVINMKGYLGDKNKNNITVLPSVLDGLFSGVQMSARTSLPLRDRAVVSCRWGVRFPDSLITKDEGLGLTNRTAGINFQKIPLLVMNKISIEHVEGGDSKRSYNEVSRETKGGDVAEMFYGVRRQLEVLQGENGLLRNAVEDLKSELGGTGKKLNLSYSGREIERGNGNNYKNSGGNNKVDRQVPHEFNGKGDVNEELKKAFKV